MKLRCNHCGREWNYKGKQEFYASCPKCHYGVNISKSKKEMREKK